MVHINQFFCLNQQNKLCKSKGKLRQDNNSFKKVFQSSKLSYASKTKDFLTSQKLDSRDFWQISNSVINKAKPAMPSLFNCLEVLSSVSVKEKLSAKSFS